jgi:hypothetical protein
MTPAPEGLLVRGVSCGHFLGARFRSLLLRSWEHMFEQGAVAKKLELAEATGLFFFFQNNPNAVLLATRHKKRLKPKKL